MHTQIFCPAQVFVPAALVQSVHQEYGPGALILAFKFEYGIDKFAIFPNIEIKSPGLFPFPFVERGIREKTNFYR